VHDPIKQVARKGISVEFEKRLEQFNEAEDKLRMLEEIWAEKRQSLARQIMFLQGSPEGGRCRELSGAYQSAVQALNPIRNWTSEAFPQRPHTIRQARLDAFEVGVFEMILLDNEAIRDLTKEIQEYRVWLIRARRELIRDQLVQLVHVFDGLLKRIVERMGPDTDAYDYEEWEELGDAFDQIQRLTGRTIPRIEHWSNMLRHLTSGQKADLRDIVAVDWPSVRYEIEHNL
jgi:hypothetical protein